MFIVLDGIFRFPVLFPIFNMSPIAYLPRQFPFETKDGAEQCVFSEGVPKCHQFAWNFPFFQLRSYCHRERYFSTRE